MRIQKNPLCWSIIVVLVLLCTFVSGCGRLLHQPKGLPPILTQDELKQPYTKLGVLEFSRESLGSVEGLTPQDFDWAYTALREGARRLDADAVILPEVRVEQNTYILFPTGQVKARGTAIRFR